LGPSLSRAIAREKKTVQTMLEIYCADHHAPADGLCPECRALLTYSHERLDRCPFCEGKPTCKDCPVHCYRPERREAIGVVMRYAGPRMLWRHPWLAIVHLWKEGARRDPGK
jgi:hypothetical protein